MKRGGINFPRPVFPYHGLSVTSLMATVKKFTFNSCATQPRCEGACKSSNVDGSCKCTWPCEVKPSFEEMMDGIDEELEELDLPDPKK